MQRAPAAMPGFISDFIESPITQTEVISLLRIFATSFNVWAVFSVTMNSTMAFDNLAGVGIDRYWLL